MFTRVRDGTNPKNALVQMNDAAKIQVPQHIYRRHFLFFRISRYAFLEIKPGRLGEVDRYGSTLSRIYSAYR